MFPCFFQFYGISFLFFSQIFDQKNGEKQRKIPLKEKKKSVKRKIFQKVENKSERHICKPEKMYSEKQKKYKKNKAPSNYSEINIFLNAMHV